MSSRNVSGGNGGHPDEVEMTPVTTLSMISSGDMMPKVSAAESENGASPPAPRAVGGSSPHTTVAVHSLDNEHRGTSNGSSTGAALGHHDQDDADGLALSPDTLGPLLSTNQYTVRKMAAQALMDVALMMANISQLRTLITAGPEMEYYYALLCLVSISLFAQILFAIIIFIIWLRETEDSYREDFINTISQVAASKVPEAAAAKQTLVVDKAKQEEKFRRHQVTNRLNYCTIVLVFIITVINMFITGFGIKLADSTTAIFSVETDQKVVEAAETGQAIGG